MVGVTMEDGGQQGDRRDVKQKVNEGRRHALVAFFLSTVVVDNLQTFSR